MMFLVVLILFLGVEGYFKASVAETLKEHEDRLKDLEDSKN
jgi:outer membrane lipoprotein-sorting protein